MHIDVLLGSEQASCPLSRHAASASFSDPGTDLKPAPVATLQSQMPFNMSQLYLRNNSNMFVGQVLPLGRGRSVLLPALAAQGLLTPQSRYSKHTHRNPESA